jgi:DNA-binding response OmpR family regulator
MGKTFKILMIDDDPDYIEAIKAILESKSYEVIFATSGEAGLRLALEKKPQLILLDVIMPGKSGFSTAEEF